MLLQFLEVVLEPSLDISYLQPSELWLVLEFKNLTVRVCMYMCSSYIRVLSLKEILGGINI